MLNSIRQFFEKKLVNNEEEQTSSSIAKTDLACAALLIEVINSDHKLEEQEILQRKEVLIIVNH